MQVTLSAQSSQGSFQADREKDILSAALGNSEHPGRTRGAGVFVTWEQWFQADSGSYRSRKRAKAEHDAKLREDLRASLRDELTEKIRAEVSEKVTQEVTQSFEERIRAFEQKQIETFEERIRGLQMPSQLETPAPTIPLASPPKHPSSCASNPNPTTIGDDRFSVDDIQVIIIISRMLNPLIGLLE